MSLMNICIPNNHTCRNSYMLPFSVFLFYFYQLHGIYIIMQATKAVSLIIIGSEVYLIHLYVLKFVNGIWLVDGFLRQ